MEVADTEILKGKMEGEKKNGFIFLHKTSNGFGENQNTKIVLKPPSCFIRGQGQICLFVYFA